MHEWIYYHVANEIGAPGLLLEPLGFVVGCGPQEIAGFWDKVEGVVQVFGGLCTGRSAYPGCGVKLTATPRWAYTYNRTTRRVIKNSAADALAAVRSIRRDLLIGVTTPFVSSASANAAATACLSVQQGGEYLVGSATLRRRRPFID